LQKLTRRFAIAWFVASVLVVLALAAPGGVLGTTVPETPTPDGSEPSGSDSELAPELPPPDFPTSNLEGYTFDLRYALSAELDGVPREAAVYELLREEPTVESVQAVADKLGIDADVEDQGDGSFTASGNGQLFVTIDQVQYFSPAEVGEGDLPSDEKAIAEARDWLRQTKLLPPDIGEGRIVTRIPDSNRLIIGFAPIEPENVLSGYPSITVTMGADGVVIEAAIRWANIVRADVYQLVSPQEAWQLVSSGQAYLAPDLREAKIDPGTDVKGRVTFTSISIAYATAGPPGGRQYLQPIYVFKGRIRPEGDERTYPVTAYVSALSNSGAPVG
jgi:hypothetical protein